MNMRMLTFWAITLGLLATFPAEYQRLIVPASVAEFATFYSTPASWQGSGTSESIGGSINDSACDNGLFEAKVSQVEPQKRRSLAHPATRVPGSHVAAQELLSEGTNRAHIPAAPL